MLNIGQLKIGMILQVDNAPYIVLKAQHLKMGRGGAVLKTKLKNLISGETLARTFREADKLAEANLTRQQATYLYQDVDSAYFMATENFEQFSLAVAVVGKKMKYLTENSEVTIMYFNNQPVNVDLPVKVNLKVTEAPPGARGDTAQGNVTKTITLETGLHIQAPLFIKEGDNVRVNTETGEYVERS